MTSLKSNEKPARRSADVIHSFHFKGDDKTLIEGMRANHAEAYRVFYRRHAPFVSTVLLRALGTNDELDSLIHDVFMRAFGGIDRIRDVSQVKSWLAAIAVNAVRDVIRQRRRTRWLHFFAPAELPDPVCEAGDEKAAVEAVYKLLDRLSVDYRIAFALRYINDMELTEVAEACNVSLATIKRRLAKAKKQFYALAKDEPALRGWIS